MKIFLCLVFLLLPYTSSAAVMQMRTSIIRLLAHSNQSFGGCMVQLSSNIMDETGLNCDTKWVSLGCVSDIVPEDGSARMWANAELAFVLGIGIYININDEKRHSGYCTAERVDVVNKPHT